MDFPELYDISDYPNWLEITPIEFGRSGENKYHIIRNNGVELILRTTDIGKYKRHRESAVFAQYIHTMLGLNMNLPIEVAACCNDTLAYTLYTWVEGVDADKRILNMHTPGQAKAGERAGELLKRIHSVAPPEEVLPWDKYYNEKIDEVLARFERYHLSFKGDSAAIGFINRNRSLLKDRPQTALHGDFRSGNLVFDSNGEYGVIDFDRWCWGDPYMDFQCIRRSCSVPFSRGQILGYFGGSVPMGFFPLMALYTAVDSIRNLCDAYPFGENAIATARASAEKTAREYNNYDGMIPSWY